MIFVTVGAQMAFDRMVRTVDEWAIMRRRDDVFAQIGPTSWRPKRIQWTAFLEPPEFRRRVESADAIVAHAGMGSILTALELGKPILVMPRRGDLGETRNDHQVSTARRFLAQGRISVAFDPGELFERLDAIDQQTSTDRIAPIASTELLSALRTFASS